MASLLCTIFILSLDNTELQIRLEGERREKEVYKGLYESLLDKLIK